MAHSFSRIHVHLVFSTKRRAPVITDEVRGALHRYMATVLQDLGCHPILINSVEDHVHLLFELGRTVAVAAVTEAIKKSSSRWIKTRGEEFAFFSWQSGYGAFAVSKSNVRTVRAYIARQRKHHARQSYQDEYRAILERHGIEFDERYAWE